MKPMKKARIALETVAWLSFVLVLALIILVFVIWRGKASMTELIERLFDFLRFGTP